jgi:HSP20 family molecular chaperone IbpA
MTFRKPSDTMWVDAVTLLERADRLHRQFFHLRPDPASGPAWEPPIDMFETGRHLHVQVALPGVAPSHVKVVIDGDALLVVGERPLPAAPGSRIRRIEIPYGRFERRIGLPQGQFEIRESQLADGCLLLDLLRLN